MGLKIKYFIKILNFIFFLESSVLNLKHGFQFLRNNLMFILKCYELKLIK